MAITTEQQVLAAARQCFFRHGYRASNMTLISEYSGFSRATIHKYFKNKEDALRQVCNQYQQKANHACLPILKMDIPCWDAIHRIVETWLTPMFMEVEDKHIQNDLKYHVRHVAEDIFSEARQGIEDMLTDLLIRGGKSGEVVLTKANMSERDLAKVLLASLDGLRGHFQKTELESAYVQVLTIFKLASR